MAVAAAALAGGQIKFQVGIAQADLGGGDCGLGSQQRAAEVGVDHHACGVYDPAKMGSCGRNDYATALGKKQGVVELGRVGEAAGADIGAQPVQKIGDRIADHGPGQGGETRGIAKSGQDRIHGWEQAEKILHGDSEGLGVGVRAASSQAP